MESIDEEPFLSNSNQTDYSRCSGAERQLVRFKYEYIFH